MKDSGQENQGQRYYAQKGNLQRTENRNDIIITATLEAKRQ